MNLAYTDFVEPTLYGDPFPSGFVAQIQLSRTVARFNSDGSVAWAREVSDGRFATVNGDQIFVRSRFVNFVQILDLDGEPVALLQLPKAVNYVKIFDDKLVAVYNEANTGVDVFAWDGTLGELLWTSEPVDFGRAAAIKGDEIAITDTFGARVLIQNMTTDEIVELPAFFPNDVQWVGDYLYYVEEHLDRIVAYLDGKRTVVMAPPDNMLWQAATTEEETETCGSLVPPRSRSSDQCSNAFTLYAPNGFFVTDDGLFVADTDNSRIIYVQNGAVRSVLLGLNNVVKVTPL